MTQWLSEKWEGFRDEMRVTLVPTVAIAVGLSVLGVLVRLLGF